MGQLPDDGYVSVGPLSAAAHIRCGICHPAHREQTAVMDHYVGIDVSLDWSSVCVLDPTGRMVLDAKIASEL